MAGLWCKARFEPLPRWRWIFRRGTGQLSLSKCLRCRTRRVFRVDHTGTDQRADAMVLSTVDKELSPSRTLPSAHQPLESKSLYVYLQALQLRRDGPRASYQQSTSHSLCSLLVPKFLRRLGFCEIILGSACSLWRAGLKLNKARLKALCSGESAHNRRLTTFQG